MTQTRTSLLSLVPTLGVVFLSIGSQIALKQLKLADTSLAFAAALSGLFSAGILYLFPYFISRWYHFSLPSFGSSKGLILGLAVGLLVSCASGLLYWQVQRPTGVDFTKLKENLPRRALANLATAAMEEMGCRGGTAWMLSATFGKLAACAGGSIPFGVAHFAGKLLGLPVTMAQVAGCILAGLLLTLLYLRFGLLSALTCHWAWNSLCGGWCKTLGLADTAAFEGAWTTDLTLGIVCLTLWFFFPPRL